MNNRNSAVSPCMRCALRTKMRKERAKKNVNRKFLINDERMGSFKRQYEPQIYFNVLRKILAILLPLNDVIATVRNVVEVLSY